MIPVTKSFLPPREEFDKYLDQIWESRYLTNRGPIVQELERKIREKYKTRQVLCVSNGTIALQIAIKALGLTGEIITTPFSYVATTSSIVWEDCIPIFVDIHSEYLTIDEEKIEDAITEKTTAILATHVYGNPCHVERIQEIADKHNLKVIYDAAHCFGVEYKGQSIFNYGDVSTCSFHATKIFHTGEGGAIFCDNSDYQRIYYHHNFGHKGPIEFVGLGINAKLSEINASIGVVNLPFIEGLIFKRKVRADLYQVNLKDLNLRFPKYREGSTQNYSYFPIICEGEDSLLKITAALESNDIFARRYFYPSLNKLPYLLGESFENCDRIASSILCLPLYHDLQESDIMFICDLIQKVSCL